ncbi:MAG: hypothetical protein U0325_31845 [Polyangiales bacterium]
MRPSTTSLLLACVLSTSVAVAQPRPALSPAAVAEARDRFNRGIELYDDGNYEAAMAEFLRAYELTQNPEVLFNISATHERSGHFVEALDAMLDYERRAPSGLRRVAPRRHRLGARAPPRAGTIVVRFDAEGLDVRVDGLQRPATEARTGLRVPAGRHRVALAALPLPDPRGVRHRRRQHHRDRRAAGARARLHGRRLRRAGRRGARRRAPGGQHADERRRCRCPRARTVVVQRAGYTAYETDVNSVSAGARGAQLAWSDPIRKDVQGAAGGAGEQAQHRDAGRRPPRGARRARAGAAGAAPPPRRAQRLLARGAGEPRRGAGNLSVFLNPTPEFRERWSSEIRTRRVIGITVGLAGLAVAGGGLGWYFVNEGDVSDSQTRLDSYNAILNNCRSSGQALCSNNMNYVANENLRNTAQADNDNALVRRYVAIGVAGLGGAVAIAGIIVLATGPSSSRFERHASITPTFTLQPGMQTAGFQVRF